MSLPTFFVIGAPRSGTTSLYDGLRQHPRIFMSPFKEPWFYALEGDERRFEGPGDPQGIRDRRRYEDLFANADGARERGEASTLYLYSERACRSIDRDVDDAKIVVILRNPVDRAYSNYLQHVQQGRETESFATALDLEDQRLARGWSPFWGYRGMGLYARHVERYFDRYGRDRFAVFLHRDLRDNPAQLFARLFSFLGVEPAVEPDLSSRRNPSGTPKSAALEAFLTRPHLVKRLLKPLLPKGFRRSVAAKIRLRNLEPATGLPETVRRELREFYRRDVERLSELVDRDLTAWTRG